MKDFCWEKLQMVQTEKTVWSRLLVEGWCLKTSADSSYEATLRFGSAEVRIKDTILSVHYHPSTDRRSLHFWGAIAYDGTVRLTKATKKCNSLSTFWKNPRVKFFPKLAYKLVDDNAPIHRSHAETRNGIQSVPWSDLNPIVNVWALWKLSYVERNYVEFADLGSTVFDIWNKFPNELVSKKYESMPKRILKCNSNTGFPTKYWYHVYFLFLLDLMHMK